MGTYNTQKLKFLGIISSHIERDVSVSGFLSCKRLRN